MPDGILKSREEMEAEERDFALAEMQESLCRMRESGKRREWMHKGAMIALAGVNSDETGHALVLRIMTEIDEAAKQL